MDFVTAELLRHCALAPEESIAALHFGVAFSNMDCEYLTHRLRQNLHRRITVSGDVLDAGAQSVGVLDPRHGAVIAHPQKDLPSNGVRHGKFPRGRRREILLELKRGAFALLDKDFKVRRCDSKGILAGGPSETSKGRNHAVKQGRRENRESENPEEIIIFTPSMYIKGLGYGALNPGIGVGPSALGATTPSRARVA